MDLYRRINDSMVTHFEIFEYMLKGLTTEEIMLEIDHQYPDEDDQLSQDEIWEAIQQVASNWDECVRAVIKE